MKRRDFLSLSITGLAAIVVDSTGIPGFFDKSKVYAAQKTIELDMVECMAEMVDLVQVYSWAFADPVNGPKIPGPVIFCQEGDLLDIKINNTMDEAHGFAILGKGPDGSTPIVNSGPIFPRQSRRLRFPAPPPGTYWYLDPLNAPLHRVMGLHGALVVMPTTVYTPFGVLPSSHPVQKLFTDLGESVAFPGNKWVPERTRFWIFNSVDPHWNAYVRDHDTIDLNEYKQTYLPRYFTINGRSGYFSAHDPSIELRGSVGEPLLIRCMNAGMPCFSPHIHANHVYVLSENNQILNNIWWIDTWSMRPLDRKDVLVPFTKPPDIPDAAWPPVEEEFPLQYPMHCHLEMSQTAAGGNYPQGLVTHFVFEGPAPGGHHHY